MAYDIHEIIYQGKDRNFISYILINLFLISKAMVENIEYI